MYLVEAVSASAALERHNAAVPVVDLLMSQPSQPPPRVNTAVASDSAGGTAPEMAAAEPAVPEDGVDEWCGPNDDALMATMDALETPARHPPADQTPPLARTGQHRRVKQEPAPFSPGSEPPAGAMNAEQSRVVELARERKNIFFTGAAGTGKSFTIHQLVTLFKSIYRTSQEFSERVCLTAPTGIAATHINGVTINSATGIGVPKLAADFGRLFAKRLPPQPGCAAGKQIWSEMAVMIFDEVSMLSGG